MKIHLISADKKQNQKNQQKDASLQETNVKPSTLLVVVNVIWHCMLFGLVLIPRGCILKVQVGDFQLLAPSKSKTNWRMESRSWCLTLIGEQSFKKQKCVLVNFNHYGRQRWYFDVLRVHSSRGIALLFWFFSVTPDVGLVVGRTSVVCSFWPPCVRSSCRTDNQCQYISMSVVCQIIVASVNQKKGLAEQSGKVCRPCRSNVKDCLNDVLKS